MILEILRMGINTITPKARLLGRVLGGVGLRSSVTPGFESVRFNSESIVDSATSLNFLDLQECKTIPQALNDDTEDSTTKSTEDERT